MEYGFPDKTYCALHRRARVRYSCGWSVCSQLSSSDADLLSSVPLSFGSYPLCFLQLEPNVALEHCHILV